MAELVLGPLLRYVDERRATVWVETSGPCEVRVLDARAPTFAVHGHHYALVQVDGLAPGTETPYTVELDGEPVWPEMGSPWPPSVIRTLRPGGPYRLTFGSCRTSVPNTPRENRTHGVDVLRGFATTMTRRGREEWPDALLLVGDQVYADETSEEIQRFIASRRDLDSPPGTELADFEEYTLLYRVAWREPAIRWVLSTLPSMMIFDDHDIRDDWNTSQAWRDAMDALPWWPARIVGGLVSYWVYQHVGNLSPDDLADDPLYARVLAAARDGGDAGPVLDEFAWGTHAEPAGTRWSYARDVGRNRLVVVDSRCGRVLTPGGRAMLDEEEWSWVRERLTGDIDHLVVGTSLPYLLPQGLHHVEGWDEAVADGAWGRRLAPLGERIRQGVDLEHWAAFRSTFDAVARALGEVAAGRRGRPPATIVFASGDVHYSYLARAHVPEEAETRIYQAVCSPIRNPLPRALRLANVFASFAVARAVGAGLARAARVRDPALSWDVVRGPWFANALATLTLHGRSAHLRWDTAAADGRNVYLREVGVVPLTSATLASTPAESLRWRRFRRTTPAREAP